MFFYEYSRHDDNQTLTIHCWGQDETEKDINAKISLPTCNYCLNRGRKMPTKELL